MKALVVDDDLTNRMILETVLSRFGEVKACAGGAEGVRAQCLAIEEGKPYDLVCMDLLMPGMSGLEAIGLIRQEEAARGVLDGSKIVVITSREDAGSIQDAFGQLCNAYVVKPVDTENLLNVVECLCDLGGPRVR